MAQFTIVIASLGILDSPGNVFEVRAAIFDSNKQVVGIGGPGNTDPWRFVTNDGTDPDYPAGHVTADETVASARSKVERAVGVAVQRQPETFGASATLKFVWLDDRGLL